MLSKLKIKFDLFGDEGWNSRAAGILLVGLACLIVYLRTLSADFVWYDDFVHIYDNDHFKPTTLHNLIDFWRHPFAGLYIPVSYMGFALIGAIARLPHPGVFTDSYSDFNPHVFHAANLILHICNSACVYLFLRKIVKKQLPAVLGALLFALHPMQVESVAWISELRGQISSLFGLLATAAYMRMTDAPEGENVDEAHLARRRNIWLYLLATILFALSILSKPSGLVFVCLTPLLDFAARGGKARKYQLLHMVPWLAFGIGISVATSIIQDEMLDLSSQTVSFQRPFVVTDAFLFYLMKLFAPYPLCVDYGRSPSVAINAPDAWAKINYFLLICGGVWFFSRKYPWVLWSALIMLVVLAPNCGIVPFTFQYYSTVADRYMYLAMIGPALALAEIVALNRWKPLLVIPLALLATCGVLTWQRASLWKNTFTLMKHDAGVNPYSIIIVDDLGLCYEKKGEFDTAIMWYKLPIKKHLNNARAYYCLGHAYDQKGEIQEAERNYVTCLQYAPKASDYLVNAAGVFNEIGSPFQALMCVNRIIKHDVNTLGRHLAKGNSLLMLKQYKDAVNEYRLEIRYHPVSVPAYVFCGMALKELGQNSEGDAMLEIGRKREVSRATYTLYLAKGNRMLGRYDEMRKDLDMALKITPNDKEVLREKRSYELFLTIPKSVIARDRESFEKAQATAGTLTRLPSAQSPSQQELPPF